MTAPSPPFPQQRNSTAVPTLDVPLPSLTRIPGLMLCLSIVLVLASLLLNLFDFYILLADLPSFYSLILLITCNIIRIKYWLTKRAAGVSPSRLKGNHPKHCNVIQNTIKRYRNVIWISGSRTLLSLFITFISENLRLEETCTKTKLGTSVVVLKKSWSTSESVNTWL